MITMPSSSSTVQHLRGSAALAHNLKVNRGVGKADKAFCIMYGDGRTCSIGDGFRSLDVVVIEAVGAPGVRRPGNSGFSLAEFAWV